MAAKIDLVEKNSVNSLNLINYSSPLKINGQDHTSFVAANHHKHAFLRLASYIHTALVSKKIDFSRNVRLEDGSNLLHSKWSRYIGCVVVEEFTGAPFIFLSSFIDIIGSPIHANSFDIDTWTVFKQEVKDCIANHGIGAGSIRVLSRLIMTGLSLVFSLGQAAIDTFLFSINKVFALFIGGIVHSTVFAIRFTAVGVASVMEKTFRLAKSPFAALIREVRSYLEEVKTEWEIRLIRNLALAAISQVEKNRLEEKAFLKNVLVAFIGQQKIKERFVELNETVLGFPRTTKLQKAWNSFKEKIRPSSKSTLQPLNIDECIKNFPNKEFVDRLSKYTPIITEEEALNCHFETLEKAQDFIRILHLARLLANKNILNEEEFSLDLRNIQRVLINSDSELLKIGAYEIEYPAIESMLYDDKVLYFFAESTSEIETDQFSQLDEVDEVDEAYPINPGQLSILAQSILIAKAYWEREKQA
jgi:hypothetical protein